MIYMTKKSLLHQLEEEKKCNRKYLSALMEEQEKNNNLLRENGKLKSRVSMMELSLEDMRKKCKKLLDERRRIDNLRLKAIAEKNELKAKLAAMEDDLR